MAQITPEIKEKVRQFSLLAKQFYPVERVFVFGSYAKGTPRQDSDIDVGVVVNMPDHLQRVEITAKLFHCAGKVDTAIEPKCVFADEYKNHNSASILAEIIRTGIEIV